MGLTSIFQNRALDLTSKHNVVINSVEPCESCGKEMDPILSAKDLENNFINDARQSMFICSECFEKRYKLTKKKRSGYGGTIYELEEKSAPRFGFGNESFSCLKCDWVAWNEEGLIVHMRRRHP